MSVNRLIILSIFMAVLLLATPLFNVGTVEAALNPAPSKAHAWFYPAADPVPISPGDPPSLITLWVVETKSSGIDYVDQVIVTQPSGFPYVLGGVEVYAFDNDTNQWSLVSGTGTGDWQATSNYFGAEITGYTIDWVGPSGTQLNNYTGAVGDVNAYEALVIKMIVIGYKNPTDAITGVTNEWTVSVRWNSGDALDIRVDHTVDNTPPSVQLTPGTASLLSQPCLPTTSFWFNVSVSDNLPLTGLNETEYGAYVQNGTDFAATNLVSGFTKTQALNFDVGLEWYISKSLKNDYLPSILGTGIPDFEPNSLPTGVDTKPFNGYVVAGDPTTPVNESTEGELGYLWAFIVVFIEVDFYPSGSWDANYTYFTRLPHLGGNVFGTVINLNNAFRVQGPAFYPATLGAGLSQVAQMRVTFVVAAFDATLDYHKDWSMSNGTAAGYNDYNDTVSADLLPSRNWYNMQTAVYSALIDINAAPINVQLNSNPIFNFAHPIGLEPTPFPQAPHINYATPFFTLQWSWNPLYGPDPTAQEFIVQIDRWNGTKWINVINDTVPAVPLSGPFFYTFDIIAFGNGNYSIHIYVRDCGGVLPAGAGSLLGYPPTTEYRYEFNVSYFLVVYVNDNEYSLWMNGPGSWEQFEQTDLIPISVLTFGVKPDGTPLDWNQYFVNITLNTQVAGPSVTNVTSFVAASPSYVAPTFAWWNFTVDTVADLLNMIGIFNVTASWVNASNATPYQMANNFATPSTFIVKPKIFLHFYVYDDEYSTGETATFFAHVADVAGSGVGGAMVAYDVFRDADGVPMATGFWMTNAQGFVVPSTFGEITFGTEIGDDWPAGLYNVNATAYLNTTVGQWLNPMTSMWEPVFAISTSSAADQFSVWVYRDADIQQGFNDVLAAISSLSSDLANLANDVSNVISILNNDVLPALSDIMSQLGSLASTVADLQSAVSDLQGAVADLQSTVAALSDIQSALSSLSSDVADVKSALNSLAGDVSDLAGALDNLAAAVSDVQGALDNLAGDINDVKSALNNLQGAVDDLAGAVDDVMSAVDSLASDVSSGFSDLSSKIDGVSQSVSSAESNLADKIDSVAGDLSGMATASLVLLVVAIAISAVTAFKVFKG